MGASTLARDSKLIVIEFSFLNVLYQFLISCSTIVIKGLYATPRLNCFALFIGHYSKLRLADLMLPVAIVASALEHFSMHTALERCA